MGSVTQGQRTDYRTLPELTGTISDASEICGPCTTEIILQAPELSSAMQLPLQTTKH